MSKITRTMGLKPIPLKKLLEELEKSLIKQAMINNGRNQSAAARQLGISRSTLITKVKQYDEELKASIGIE